MLFGDGGDGGGGSSSGSSFGTVNAIVVVLVVEEEVAVVAVVGTVVVVSMAVIKDQCCEANNCTNAFFIMKIRIIVTCAKYCWKLEYLVVTVIVVVVVWMEQYRKMIAARVKEMAYIMVVYRNVNCGPYKSKILRCMDNNSMEQGLTQPIAKVIIMVEL